MARDHRQEWLVSRVSALAGLPGAALHHAQACLRLCEEHDLHDWDRAFAYEAIARARAVPIADDEDRELLEQDLEQLLER